MPKPLVLDPAILANLTSQLRPPSSTPYSLLPTPVYCLDACAFLRRLPNESVDLIVTDEPYGIGAQTIIAFRDGTRKPYTIGLAFDSDLPAHLTIPWLLEAARVLKEGGALVNCGIASWNTTFEQICQWSELTLRMQAPWIKTNPPTRVRPGGFKSAHEMVWVASKGSLSKRLKKNLNQAEFNNWMIETTCPNCEERFPVTWSNQIELAGSAWGDDVWDDMMLSPSKVHSSRIGHPNEKPDWLAARFIWLLSEEGQVVVDPFAGSGWSVVQAAKMGRQVIANDYDPEWGKIIMRRLQSIQTSLF